MAKERFQRHPGWTAKEAERRARKAEDHDSEQAKLRRAVAFRSALAAVKADNAVWRMVAMGISEAQAIIIKAYLTFRFEVKAAQCEGRWDDELKRKKEAADRLAKRVGSLFRDDPERIELLDRIETIWFGGSVL